MIGTDVAAVGSGGGGDDCGRVPPSERTSPQSWRRAGSVASTLTAPDRLSLALARPMMVNVSVIGALSAPIGWRCHSVPVRQCVLQIAAAVQIIRSSIISDTDLIGTRATPGSALCLYECVCRKCCGGSGPVTECLLQQIGDRAG